MNRTIKKLLAKLPFGRVLQLIRCLYLTKKVIEDQKGHEADIQFLKEIVWPGDHVVDVGANIGLYTKHLSQLTGPIGKVFSFEPISQNLAVLKAVIQKLQLTNVQLFHGAVSSKVGRGEVVVPETGAFEGFYLARFAQDGDKGIRETVEVFSLDNLLGQGKLLDVDFIKCDVEGAEMEVLNGSNNLIKQSHPCWLIEVSRDISQEVFSFLQAYGYKAFVYREKLIPTSAFQDGQFSNYFFLHPESKYWKRKFGQLLQTCDNSADKSSSLLGLGENLSS